MKKTNLQHLDEFLHLKTVKLHYIELYCPFTLIHYTTLEWLYTTLTSLYNVHLLTPQFHIIKLGLTGVYIFSYFCSKTLIVGTHYNRLIEAVLMCTHNLCFRAKIKKYHFYLNIIVFTAVKNCTILHGHVIVMFRFYNCEFMTSYPHSLILDLQKQTCKSSITFFINNLIFKKIITKRSAIFSLY